MTYAVHTNVEGNAINDAIFAQHLRKTHSKKIESAPLRQQTFTIKASKLKWKMKRRKWEYVDKNATAKDLL